jgi:NAD(P)-dependent dehydrogenase (short-subunit alcohol dehydrogenase family)
MGPHRQYNVTTSYLRMMRKGFSPYGCTKAAVEAWTKMLSRQLEGSGVTANVVLPGGPVDTQMIVDSPGLDRAQLISPSVMAPSVLSCSPTRATR